VVSQTRTSSMRSRRWSAVPSAPAQVKHFVFLILVFCGSWYNTLNTRMPCIVGLLMHGCRSQGNRADKSSRIWSSVMLMQSVPQIYNIPLRIHQNMPIRLKFRFFLARDLASSPDSSPSGPYFWPPTKPSGSTDPRIPTISMPMCSCSFTRPRVCRWLDQWSL